MQKTIQIDNAVDIKNASPDVLSQVYTVLSELTWTQTVLGKAQRGVVNPFDSSGIEIGRDDDLIDVSFINTDALSKLTEVRNMLLINSNNIINQYPGAKKVALSANLSVSIAALFDAALGMADAVMTKLVHQETNIDDDSSDSLLDTGANAAFLISRSTGELDKLTLVWSRLKGVHWLGKISVGAYLLSGTLASMRLSKLFTSPSVEPLGKAMATTQVALDSGGGLGVVAFTAIATHRIRTATAIGRVPLIGLFVSILATALSPLTFYSIAKEVEYAKKLDKVSNQLLSYHYSGYQELAEIYRSKAWVQGAFETARMVLGIGGGAVSALAMAGVVTFPIAFAIGVAVIVSMGILDAGQQPTLEKIAKHAQKNILAWETKNNGKNYFENGLYAYYLSLKPKLRGTLVGVQHAWSVEQVAAVTQIKADTQMRELAAITRLTEKLPSAGVYADIFKNGHIDNEQKIFLDSVNGVINLPDKHDKYSQALLFITPLMVPGFEVSTRTKTGKNQFTTQLTFTPASGWQIHDGQADSVADFSNVVQRVKLMNGEVKNIPIKVNMGGGNDQIILSTNDMEVNGGEGEDVADYRKLPVKDAYIEVNANPDLSYTVKKFVLKTNAYEEVLKIQQNKYGKRTEQIQYRDLEIVTLTSQRAIDTLYSIESVLGTSLNDVFSGGMHDERFYGFGGDDWLDGKDGNDMLDGGSGKDFLMGGKGNDWLNGGVGNDTYFFNLGDGKDFVIDVDLNLENQDKLMLGDGLNKRNVWLTRQGYDLELSVIGNEDKVVFSGWYLNKNHVIEKIFLDREVLTSFQADLLVQAMAEFTPPVMGEVFTYPTELMSTLSSYWYPNQ